MEAKETALRILDESRLGTMATVSEGKPHSRYMTFLNDGFTLFTPTSKGSEKVDELESNPYTHILIGYEGEGFGDAYLEILGRVSISEDEGLKEKIWNDRMKNWFEGPHDPKLVILKVTPESARLMNKSGEPPQDIQF